MVDDIRQITGIPEGFQPSGKPTTKQSTEKSSFGQVLGGIIKEVDNLHKNAEKTTDKLITGELEDVHQVVVAMEEAETSFRLLMEIRNKMVDAYKEVMKMQV